MKKKITQPKKLFLTRWNKFGSLSSALNHASTNEIIQEVKVLNSYRVTKSAKAIHNVA